MRFLCESGNLVTVLHGGGPDGAGIKLGYRGRNFDLYPIQSSGDRFGTEQGLETDRGLRWEMVGNTWLLKEMIMDRAAPDAQVLESCVADDGTSTASWGGRDVPVGTWKVASLRGVSLVSGHEPIATLNIDGSITGNTGCNTFGSVAVFTDEGVSISNGFMTRMGCEEERHVVERAFLDALEAAASIETNGEQLMLLDRDGMELATFRRHEPSSE